MHRQLRHRMCTWSNRLLGGLRVLEEVEKRAAGLRCYVHLGWLGMARRDRLQCLLPKRASLRDEGSDDAGGEELR